MALWRSALAALTLVIIAMPIDMALADKAKAIVGVYWNPDKTRKVEITQTGSTFTGRVVWETAPTNGQSSVGRTIMRNFRFDGKDKWVDGEVNNPVNGKTIKGKLWLENGDLVMRGFFGMSFLGRTVRLERVR